MRRANLEEEDNDAGFQKWSREAFGKHGYDGRKKSISSGAWTRHGRNGLVYDSMSARSLAIAKHQKEMMKLVQDLPELNYELTLQDLVETTEKQDSTEKSAVDVAKEEKREFSGNNWQNGKTKQREEKVGVFLLKMSFPVALNDKSNTDPGKGGSKVIPKHIAYDGEITCHETSSSSSSSSSKRRNNHKRRGFSNCWSFYNRRCKTYINS